MKTAIILTGLGLLAQQSFAQYFTPPEGSSSTDPAFGSTTEADSSTDLGITSTVSITTTPTTTTPTTTTTAVTTSKTTSESTSSEWFTYSSTTSYVHPTHSFYSGYPRPGNPGHSKPHGHHGHSTHSGYAGHTGHTGHYGGGHRLPTPRPTVSESFAGNVPVPRAAAERHAHISKNAASASGAPLGSVLIAAVPLVLAAI